MRLLCRLNNSQNYRFSCERRSFAEIKNKFFFNNIEELKNEGVVNQIKNLFEKKGYVLFSAPSNDKQTFSSLARLFGKIQSHIRSPNDGIVEIKNVLPAKNDDKQINSNLHFFPHTDGAYLKGIKFQGKKNYRVEPPKIILLQCVKPALEGGTSFIVDGKAILIDLIEKNPLLIKYLFSRDCMNIYRGDHLIMDLPIYSQQPSGKFSIRYSYDRDLHLSKLSFKALTFFNNYYILSSRYTNSFSLKKSEILALDNYRFLHGRTAFVGERILRRIWICDETASEELIIPQNKGEPYFSTGKHSLEKLPQFQHYGSIQNRSKAIFHAESGIALNSHLMRKLRKIDLLHNPL